MTPLNIVLVEEITEHQMLQETLQNDGYQVVSVNIAEFDTDLIQKISPDIILLNISKPQEQTFQIILSINQNHRIPIVLFSKDQDTETINKVIKAGASAYIVDGIKARRIKSIIDIAIIRFKEQQALKDELAETKSKLEDRKLIDRAKAILIDSKSYSEDEAYHSLRKLAMKRNIAIAEMAKNVIAMADLFSKNST